MSTALSDTVTVTTGQLKAGVLLLAPSSGHCWVQDLQRGLHVITNSTLVLSQPSLQSLYLVMFTSIRLLLLLLLNPLVHHQLVEFLPRHLVNGNPLDLLIVNIVEDNLG